MGSVFCRVLLSLLPSTPVKEVSRPAAPRRAPRNRPQVEPPKAYVLDEESGAWTELEDPIEVSSPALEEKPKKQKTPKKKGKCTPKQAFENAREPTSPEAFLKAFAKDPRNAALKLTARRSGFFNCDSPRLAAWM